MSVKTLMKNWFLTPSLVLALTFILVSLVSTTAAETSSPDSGAAIRTLDSPREFPRIDSAAEWKARAKEIRENVLVSSGLWPMPEKTPLHARIFGKIERDGYTVEKVAIETFPGFFLGGNLYRPLGHGKGPFPGILNPHGHWSEGRLTVAKDGSSIPARCISFARQGMVAFAYDMVGFNDTRFKDSPTNRPFYEVHRLFATNRADLLWNISLMGLQTWDSIRALDFLASLPDVDPRRLACTGASGGGTQTFMLGSIEDRLAAQAPVVMVSHIMQGGCSCENEPGLRVEFSNMEIAAAAAPRPQILVAATGDWTRFTMTMEGPAIAHIYELLGAPEKLRYTRFDFDHNYNATSRAAVYDWFDKWLLKQPIAFKESACAKEADSDLRVFPEGQVPADALTREQMSLALRKLHREQWQSRVPGSRSGLRLYERVFLPAWRHTLQVEWPMPQAQVTQEAIPSTEALTAARVTIKRPGAAAGVAATYWAPASILTARHPNLVVLCADHAGSSSPAGAPEGLVHELVRNGIAVLNVDRFTTGEPPDQFANFYSTYNRTEAQERVRDLLTVCAAARQIDPRKAISYRVTLAGSGRAGLWALLAAPAADAVVADCTGLESTDEQALLAPDLFCPGILNLGGFEGAALLAAPHPLLLHNTGGKFTTTSLASAYQGLGAGQKLRVEPATLSAEEISAWLTAGSK
jgi:hypothetical protein